MADDAGTLSDALAPCIARTSATTVLTMKDKQVIVNQG